MDKERITQLIHLYYNKQLTELEFNELREIVLKGDEEVLQDLLQEHMEKEVGSSIPGEEMVRRMHSGTVRWWWAAAAAVLVLLGSVYLIVNKNKGAQLPLGPIAKTKDVLPGKSGAILTLSDGSKMVLDSLGNGVITTQANAPVALKDGKLIYGKAAGNDPGVVLYNTMSTPRGRQFQMVLPDGSKVWLNAASSITYPVAFSGKERLVKIRGEAYFEIAANASMPFRVQLADGEKVEVLGTSFNVNAYEDEGSFRTTLVDGKVRVSLGNGAKVLAPGEQAYAGPGDPVVKVLQDVDIAGVIAWKNNYFSFADADLSTVMRQLSRWYNVDVVFAGPVPAGRFNGKIGRALTLAQVLKLLTVARVNYTIEQNKITILAEK
ncbi:MAG TPA: FecR domain-containing protein [Puia sp.]|nr:FecR domain-containing protein [Puia sp.]